MFNCTSSPYRDIELASELKTKVFFFLPWDVLLHVGENLKRYSEVLTDQNSLEQIENFVKL